MSRSKKIRFLAILDVVVLMVGLIFAVAGREELSPPGAELELRGTAELGGRGGRMVASGHYDLAVGEVVVMRSGESVLALGDGGSLELRAGPVDGEGSRVEVGEVPRLLAGDALVLAGGREQSVVAGGARLSLRDGAARISRSIGTTVAVYRGQAALTAGGRQLQGGVPPLRQVVVPDTGMLPATARPLSFAAVPDPWDRRFLGDVIDLQFTLESRASGFTSTLRGDFTPDIVFYGAVLPGLLQQPAFDQVLLDEQSRPPGETLVGAAIALVGKGATFADRWDRAFALREAGAGWGVVAFDQGSERAPLLAALDGAFERSPLLFGPPSRGPIFRPVLPAPAPAPAPLRARPAEPSPVPGPRPVAPAPAPITSPSPPGFPALPTPAPDGGSSLLEPVVDPVVDLLAGVLNGLEGLTRGLL